MKTQSQSYEYVYVPNSTSHHHAYLMQPLLQLLLQVPVHGSTKPTVLDLGCGDGSLTRKIAECGYHVFAGGLPYLWKSMLCSSVFQGS